MNNVQVNFKKTYIYKKETFNCERFLIAVLRGVTGGGGRGEVSSKKIARHQLEA